MSKAYLITHDCKENKNLDEEIKNSLKWWHYIESTWIIITDETANEIWNRLENKINNDDNLLIIDIGNSYQGWLTSKAWDWIKKELG